MKTHLLLILLGIVLSTQQSAAQIDQNPHLADTLYVSSQATAVLIFPGAISLADLGTGGFIAKTADKVLLIKANGPSKGLTTLFVRYGKEQYFTGFIGYDSLPSLSYYDFRTAEKGGGGAVSFSPDLGPISPEVIAKDLLPEKIDLKAAKVSLERMKGLKRELFTIGSIAHHMQLGIENIRHDESLSYLSFSLQNGSSLPYRLELVSFRYREPVRGKGLADMLTELKPILIQAPDLIRPHDKDIFYVALPHFAIPSKGSLEILLREKNGTRSLIASVPTSAIMKAPIFL